MTNETTLEMTAPKTFREATTENPIVYIKTRRVFIVSFKDGDPKPFKLMVMTKMGYTYFKKGSRRYKVSVGSYENELYLTDTLQKLFKQEAEEKLKRDQKKALRAEAKKDFDINTTFAVGEIYASSWGYDQTNVYYYQIVEVKKASVMMRSINKKSVEGAFMSATAWPLKDQFVDAPKMYRIVTTVYDNKARTYISTGSSYKSFFKYDQEEDSGLSCSWYA